VHDQPWTAAPLVALDLEGTGGQNREHEQILEIAVVPLIGGRPDMTRAWQTLVNPGRTIAPRPWISPELTGGILRTARPFSQVAGDIVARVHQRVVVGHNVAVDWRLLHRHLPDLENQALIDTARLFRHLHPDARRWSLGTLTDRYELTGHVNALASGSRPHRALWDTVAAALLLSALVKELPSGTDMTLASLERVAALDKAPAEASQQTALDI
jgi:DNA polymerase III subunit epsilon